MIFGTLTTLTLTIRNPPRSARIERPIKRKKEYLHKPLTRANTPTTVMGTLLIKRLFCNGVRFAHCAGQAARRAKCTVGDKAVSTRRISQDDVMNFARLSGDTNPIHLPQDGKMAVVHGALLNGIVSSVIGTQLPGAGTLVAWQSLNFPEKCYAGENITTQVEVVSVRKIIHLKFDCSVDVCGKTGKKKCVLHGEAKVVQR